MGYNRRHYESIFIHLAIVAFQNCEIPINFDLITVQGHRSWCQSKLICDFLLVINSNFGHICYRFRDNDAYR